MERGGETMGVINGEREWPVEGSRAVNATVVWLWMTGLSLGISEQPEGNMGHFSLLLLAYAV